MKDILLVRGKGPTLVAADEASAEEVMRLSSTKPFMANVRGVSEKRARQQSLAWALATKIAESCDFLLDKDDAMEFLKHKARHVRYVIDNEGRMHVFTRSIAYDKLPDNEFFRLFEHFIHITITDILPGVEEGELRQEIEKIAFNPQRWANQRSQAA